MKSTDSQFSKLAPPRRSPKSSYKYLVLSKIWTHLKMETCRTQAEDQTNQAVKGKKWHAVKNVHQLRITIENSEPVLSIENKMNTLSLNKNI